MKFLQITALLFIITFSFTACNTELKKKPKIEKASTENNQKITFQITGMTCEIGCAKTIQSKLSKKAGITSAKIIYKDSTGLVEFNETIISTDPSSPPLHKGSIMFAKALKALGSDTVKSIDVSQSFASAIMVVYVPASKSDRSSIV